MFVIAMIADGTHRANEVVMVRVETEAEAKAMVIELQATDIKEFSYVINKYFYYET